MAPVSGAIVSNGLPTDPVVTAQDLQETVDRLLDLIRSIEPWIVTWDASGRDRDTTVTVIGLVHRKACLRIGMFRSAGQVSVMFTSKELPDPAGLLMNGAPFLG